MMCVSAAAVGVAAPRLRATTGQKVLRLQGFLARLPMVYLLTVYATDWSECGWLVPQVRG